MPPGSGLREIGAGTVSAKTVPSRSPTAGVVLLSKCDGQADGAHAGTADRRILFLDRRVTGWSDLHPRSSHCKSATVCHWPSSPKYDSAAC